MEFRSLSAFNITLQVHEFRFLFIAFVFFFFCADLAFLSHNVDFGFGGGFVGISFLGSTFSVPLFSHFGFGILAFHHIWCSGLSTFCWWHFSFAFNFCMFFSTKSCSVKGKDSKI